MDNNVLHLPCPVEQVSDGYHTFAELYEHRCVLFVALICTIGPLYSRWRARLHTDGTMVDGWFIAGIDLPTGTITYHLPIAYWALLDGNAVSHERAPAWDGHTPDDVVFRLNEWLRFRLNEWLRSRVIKGGPMGSSV